MKTLDSIKKDLSPARRKIEALTHHLIAEEMTRQQLRRARRRLPCRLSCASSLPLILGFA
jgi:hypothetical protein